MGASGGAAGGVRASEEPPPATPPPPPPPRAPPANGLAAASGGDQLASARPTIESRMEALEPDRVRRKYDIFELATYFAKVGFNTGLYIKNPHSVELSEKLDHKRIRRLIEKYELKMNVDEKFTWTYYRGLGEKLRIFDLVLAYFDVFIKRAAYTSPLDFNEERFWKCAKNVDFWESCQRNMRKLNGRERHEVRFEHASSRLLTVAILPLLNENERTLITICALSVEVRKGPLDNERYQHFYRECHRHVRANVWGSDYAARKNELRLKFGIERAARALKPINDASFHQLWQLTSKKSKLPYPIDIERFVAKSTCARHMEAIEPDRRALSADLRLLAKHFARPNAELLLRECQRFGGAGDGVDLASRRALELLDKYRILWSPIINQFSIKKYKPDKRISIDGLAREYPQLFIDAAASATLAAATKAGEHPDHEQEAQFWRCANNAGFWQKHVQLTLSKSKRGNDAELVCQLSPGRLLGCGFYRLLTPEEPKLIELCALRGAAGPEQQSYEYFKHNLLYQINRPLDKIKEDIKQKLRLRYRVAEAERELAPCSLEQFLKRRRLDEDECFSTTVALLNGDDVGDGGAARGKGAKSAKSTKSVKSDSCKATTTTWQKPLAFYLRQLEPNEQQLRADLVQLVRFFNQLGSVYLLDNRNRLRDQLDEAQRQDQAEVRMYKLAYKYRVIYSQILNTLAPAKFVVRLHRLVSDHLTLFIDTAALASWLPPAASSSSSSSSAASSSLGPPPISADERRFWWCANNLNYFQRATEEMRQCASHEQVLKTAPLRLVSIGTYRLIRLNGEPKILALNALRAAIERRDRRLTTYQYETLVRHIESVNEKLENSQRELIEELRMRYGIDKVEAELAPIDVELFLERWNSPTWQADAR